MPDMPHPDAPCPCGCGASTHDESVSGPLNDCGYRCFVIGGGFIGEDPDCPVHGTEAQRLREIEEDLAIQEHEEEQ